MDSNPASRENEATILRIQGEKALTEYLASIEGWNFVQGNVIDENISLRKNDRIKTIAIVLLATILPLLSVLYSNNAIFNGNPRVIAVPINAANGTIAGPAQVVDQSIPNPNAAILQYVLKQSTISLLEVTPLRGELNANTQFLEYYISQEAADSIKAFRAENNNAEDPFALSRQGYSGYPEIRSTINVAKNIWAVVVHRTLTSVYQNVKPISQTFTITYQIGHGDTAAVNENNPFGIIIYSMQIKENQ